MASWQNGAHSAKSWSVVCACARMLYLPTMACDQLSCKLGHRKVLLRKLFPCSILLFASCLQHGAGVGVLFLSPVFVRMKLLLGIRQFRNVSICDRGNVAPGELSFEDGHRGAEVIEAGIFGNGLQCIRGP